MSITADDDATIESKVIAAAASGSIGSGTVTVSAAVASSIANNEPPKTEVLVDRPEIERGVTRVSGPFVVEAALPAAIDLDASGDHAIFFQFVAGGLPLPRARFRIDEILVTALAFAMLLHGILLTVTYIFKDEQHRLLFPGRRDLVTSRLVNRPPKTEEKKPAVVVIEEPEEKKPKLRRKEIQPENPIVDQNRIRARRLLATEQPPAVRV